MENIDIPRETLVNSPEYVEFIYQRMKVETLLLAGKDDPELIADQISGYLTGILKERVLVFLLMRGTTSQPLKVKARSYFVAFSDSIAIAKLKALKHSLEQGKIYNFKLQDQNNKWHQASEFRGKVMVIDCWFIGCGACEVLYRDILKDLEKRFAHRKDMIFISINCNKDRTLWKKSIQKHAAGVTAIAWQLRQRPRNDVPSFRSVPPLLKNINP